MRSPPFFPFPALVRAQPEQARAWLQNFLDSFGIGILIINDANKILMANAAARDIAGLPLSLPLDDIASCLPSRAVPEFTEHCERLMRGEHVSGRCEGIFPLGSGTERRTHCAFSVLPEQADGQKLALVTLVDASAEKAALEQSELAEQGARAIFDAAADAMMVISPQGILLDLNTMTCEHVNMAREELVGKHIRTIFTPAKQQFVAAKLAEILAKNVQRTFEALLTNPDSPIPVEINARPIEFQGQPAVLGIARDITERKVLQARLEYQASRDPLTTINNRRHFLIKADQEFLRFQRYGNTFAMLMLDLDLFKNVNDTYGHQAGDALLREFARQMRGTFRHSDILGRIGGEEFSVLLLESSLHRGIEIAERLRRQVEKTPLRLKDATVPYTVSIGVTTAGASDASLDAVMRRADAAMYRAKRNGRNQVEFETAPDNPEQSAQNRQEHA